MKLIKIKLEKWNILKKSQVMEHTYPEKCGPPEFC